MNGNRKPGSPVRKALFVVAALVVAALVMFLVGYAVFGSPTEIPDDWQRR